MNLLISGIENIQMKIINYSNAQAQLTRLMDQTIYGSLVEITRKNSDLVNVLMRHIKKAAFDNNFRQYSELIKLQS